MRLAFFGSDAFSLPALHAAAEGHELVLVVTNPDRPRGRSGAPLPTQVKEEAERLGIAVLQPEGKPGAEVAARLRAEQVDLGVVVAYGQLIPREVRKAPTLGYMINLHGSLLPRWRGAAPVAAAILAGDAVTGVTVQRLGARMDAGPVLLGRETPIGPEDERGGLRERLSQLGAEAVREALARIAAGQASFVPQDEALATYAPLLSKDDGRLELARPAAELGRRVRGCTPWPGAWLELAGGGRLQVLQAIPVAGAGAPGHVLVVREPELVVACGEGALALRQVKPEGKRAMSGAAYANGRRLAAGAVLA